MWVHQVLLTNGLRAWASLVAQTVKNLPAMQETQIQYLGREDPLEKEMATHSSTLAWRILQREEPGGLQSTGSQKVRHDWVTNIFTVTLSVLSLVSLYLKISGKKILNTCICVSLRIPMGWMHCWRGAGASDVCTHMQMYTQMYIHICFRRICHITLETSSNQCP